MQKWGYVIILSICNSFSLIYLLLFYKQKRVQHFLKILLINVFTICSTFSIFISTKSSFDCGRMHLSIGALPCFILIYLCVSSNILQTTTFEKIFVGICISIGIINIYTYIVRISESRYKNELEKNYCNSILEYCEDNNYNLDKACIVAVRLDTNEIYFDEIQTRNKMTINEIRGYESAISGFNVTTKSNFEQVSVSEETLEKYMKKMDDGNTGINNSMSMYIDGVLFMPVFIW